jgi:hypothetical protein
VQLRQHRLELRDDFMRWRSGGVHHGVAVVRGQERDGVVTPVVPQTSFGEAAVGDELMTRHELNGSDAQRGEVIDHAPVRETGCSGSANR